jgi:hypothetical protein
MKLPQLSLRDLFWLVALVAMGCGWWVDRTGLSRSGRNAKQFAQIAHELREAIENMGGKAIYWHDEHGDDFGVKVVPPLPPIEISGSLSEDLDGHKTNSDPPLPQIDVPRSAHAHEPV